MPCTTCGSEDLRKLMGEIGIHVPALENNIGRPALWVFPEIVICLNCGNAEFVVPEPELRMLTERDEAG